MSAAAVRRARRVPQRRLALVVGGAAAALVAAFLLRVLGGDYTITFPDFLRILAGEQIPGATFILTESKLPRAALGLLVGVAFGVAGAIFQGTLRNPLASPDVLGVSMGASAAAVFGIVVLDVSGTALSLASITGAVTVAAAIRFAAGPSSGHRLVLVGITAAAALVAVVQYLFTRADQYDAQLALRWLTGSLNAADWATIRALATCLAVLLPVVALAARAQRVLELGPDVASALGAHRSAPDVLLLVAVLLTALGVAAAGPVAFVAFAAGPVARSLNGGRATLAGAALAGAVVVVLADHLAAYAVPDVNLPVGVVTGALGAPFLLWLLASGRAGRSSA
ncbi:MAG TPA: iron chelate uptake ABC transporter family permease subunit [Nocardioides sp.]|nr:iron chelate uptake ABC transporter family permease subunit [Nocardioides sp.]